MASVIQEEIKAKVNLLYVKFMDTDSATAKIFCDLFRAIDKLKMYNDGDFEHLWLTELNEKQDIEATAKLDIALLKIKNGRPYAAPAAWKEAGAKIDWKRKPWNPEAENFSPN
jgi:hypothetical protein